MIGDDGAAALADALAVNDTLTLLGLDNNSIGVAGAARLASAMERNGRIVELRLWDNALAGNGDADLGIIRAACEVPYQYSRGKNASISPQYR